MDTNEYLKERLDSFERTIKENTAEVAALRIELESSKALVRGMRIAGSILASLVVYIYFNNNSVIDRVNGQQDDKIAIIQQQVAVIENKLVNGGIK